MPSQTQIRDEVTARIIEALEAEVLPWRRPWRTTVGGSQPGRHSNLASRKPYQGVNPLLAGIPRPAPGTAVPLVGDVQPVAPDRLPIRKRPPKSRRGIGAAVWSSGNP